ncbi:hypothetical protein SAY87_020629 [Trapa incisa]|uniref:Uncharacterized protein n=1 Tax=Trapa incisa TaxID=236973 RepID=A0AAN7PPF1_9MYRT|nr:hypothetical protein SAY87_020629 [Trapa incisa]
MNDIDGRPEDVTIGFLVIPNIHEVIGTESRELIKYRAQMEDRAQREEEFFIRAPITKREKKKEKHLMKSMNGGSTEEEELTLSCLSPPTQARMPWALSPDVPKLSLAVFIFSYLLSVCFKGHSL